ncbi:hypothetical protein SY83_08650 [Paenibacillus swuensis]|uniref:DUF4038 domain-containing protein n=1 Tax=Paenibacillus swuensis TaxID=1178515 RepID=A0A172TH10_9BACL|nr:glycoside hydrolase family 140 protein [Paenibacillus swuensis]ANE46335.1 hypothetical protein SY83_08650 [Paenibacillus swuensis]
MKALKVSENGRFLVTEDEQPFFWLGDTAWELFHKLNREEAVDYLNQRAALGFTVVQAVALAELEGLTVPNRYGRLPLAVGKDGSIDPESIDDSRYPDSDYTYWDHVDYILETAASLGIYVALLPTWGDKYNLKWGKGPVIFNPDNAREYGRWIGKRYGHLKHIIWVLGGDRPLETEEHYAVNRSMAAGIKESSSNLITFHPCGGASSSQWVHHEDWLDFNMIQSGHNLAHLHNDDWVTKDYHLTPVKPTVDAEPRYEDHPIDFLPESGYFDDWDVRQAAYWGFLAGGFGITYGHHCVWPMNTEPTPYFPMHWREALGRPAATHMQHLKKLALSHNLLELLPDQGLVVVAYEGGDRLVAARGKQYAYVYSPTGKSVHARFGLLVGEQVAGSWYNPRSGETMAIGAWPNTGTLMLHPPSSGRGQDWVLVLDSR